MSYRQPGEPVEYRARVFALTSGYCWTPHLLLLSRAPRFPNGLANRSGLVGRYMCGHAFQSAMIEIDARIYPGMNEQHGLISRQFFRAPDREQFVRHDLRVWESASGHEPRLRSAEGGFCWATACWRIGGSAPNVERRASAATTMCTPTAIVR